MRKFVKVLWEIWNLLKDFHEHHEFLLYCMLVVPPAATASWAWLVRFDGLAIFLICLITLASVAVLVAAGVVMANWGEHQTLPEPKPQAPGIEQTSPVTYLTPYEAIHYLSDESQWAEDKARAISPEALRFNVLLEAPGEFQEKAAEGRVRVFGFNSNSGKHEEIDKTHWMSFGLGYSGVFRPGERVRTEPSTMEAAYHDGSGGYSDLKIVAADVYRTWPRSSSAECQAVFDVVAMSRDDAIDALWQLRRVGVAIRNEPVKSEGDFFDWKARYDKWRSDVLEVADKFDEGLRHRLEVLDRVRQAPALPAINPEHALCIRVASEILLRLEEKLP